MRKAIRRWVRNWIALTIRAERIMDRLGRTDPEAWARVQFARQDHRGISL